MHHNHAAKKLEGRVTGHWTASQNHTAYPLFFQITRVLTNPPITSWVDQTVQKHTTLNHSTSPFTKNLQHQKYYSIPLRLSLQQELDSQISSHLPTRGGIRSSSPHPPFLPPPPKPFPSVCRSVFPGTNEVANGPVRKTMKSTTNRWSTSDVPGRGGSNQKPLLREGLELLLQGLSGREVRKPRAGSRTIDASLGNSGGWGSGDSQAGTELPGPGMEAG